MPFVPTRSRKRADTMHQFLFSIEPETVLHAALSSMSFDIGHRIATPEECSYGFAVATHVRVIHVIQQPDRCAMISNKSRPKFDFGVFGPCSPQIPVQIDAIRHLRHQRFSKPHAPVAAMVLGDSGECVSPRVRRIVVGAVIVHRPVHELQMTVAAWCADVEEIRNAHLTHAEFETPFGPLSGQREESALRGNNLFAERNRLMQHQASQIWL
jgi:hypothetical protein